MSADRDLWLNYSPAAKVDKIRKKITVPIFGVNCGEAKSCLRLFSNGTNQGYIDHILISAPVLTAALTIEAWVNIDFLPPRLGGPDDYAVIFQRSDVAILVLVYIDARGIVVFEIIKGAAVNLVESSVPIATGEWNHISCSWDGTTMRTYINTILVGSTALVAPADGFTAGGRHHYMGLGTRVVGTDSYKQFKGKIDEVRIWNVGRTRDQIIGSYLSPRNIVAADNVDDDLKHYYKFQEAAGAITVDSITGENASILIGVNQYSWITDDGFPYRYGASFICNLISVTVGMPCSIKFPIDIPDDPDHAMFVRYQDRNGDWQRRMLYDSGESYDNVDVHPFLYSGIYNGERLSETFYLEIWNVDGQATANLEDEIEIKLSLTSDPATSTDNTALSAATPTISTALASVYPLANPMVPDTTQTY